MTQGIWNPTPYQELIAYAWLPAKIASQFELHHKHAACVHPAAYDACSVILLLYAVYAPYTARNQIHTTLSLQSLLSTGELVQLPNTIKSEQMLGKGESMLQSPPHFITASGSLSSNSPSRNYQH